MISQAVKRMILYENNPALGIGMGAFWWRIPLIKDQHQTTKSSSAMRQSVPPHGFSSLMLRDEEKVNRWSRNKKDPSPAGQRPWRFPARQRQTALGASCKFSSAPSVWSARCFLSWPAFLSSPVSCFQVSAWSSAAFCISFSPSLRHLVGGPVRESTHSLSKSNVTYVWHTLSI